MSFYASYMDLYDLDDSLTRVSGRKSVVGVSSADEMEMSEGEE